MKNKLKYYFDLVIYFDKEIDIHKMAKNFSDEPYEIVTNSEAVDKNKTAKLFYYSNLKSEYDVAEEFSNYIKQLKQNFPNLKQIMQENNGEAWLTIVFNKVDKCALYFREDTVKDLSELGVNFEIIEE